MKVLSIKINITNMLLIQMIKLAITGLINKPMKLVNRFLLPKN